MPDMMAIVSKAVFEKESPNVKIGDVLPTTVYRSAHKAFEKLSADGSRLFLVTIRPPDERMWLVAVLEGLKFDGQMWTARKNARAVTDITHLREVLKFDSGKGITAAKGQLGMSLQTPRTLTPADALALLGAAGGASEATEASGPPNLTAHQPGSALPCLCRTCLPNAPKTMEHSGMSFMRASTEAKGRVLHFWVPSELEGSLTEISNSVKSSLLARLKDR